jgi:molybdopterin/thiamine biosynthesis adenylyltransferase
MLGALSGILGAKMVLEVIREIVGFGEGLVGRLMLVDALGMPTSFFSGLFARSGWGIVQR